MLLGAGSTLAASWPLGADIIAERTMQGPEPEGGTATAATELLEWVAQRGACLHPALRVTSASDEGRGLSVDSGVAAGTVLLRIPLQLCIAAPATPPKGARKAALWSWRSAVSAASALRVAEHLAAVSPALPQPCTHAVLLAYLLSHRQCAPPVRRPVQPVDAPNLFGLPLPGWLFEGAAAPEGGGQPLDLEAEPEEEPGCGHALYLACLPGPEEMNLLPCWPAHAKEPLACTSLAPQLAAHRRQKRGSVGALLASTGEEEQGDEDGEAMAAFLRSALPRRPAGAADGMACLSTTGEGGAVMTDATARRYLEHAALLCKSRAFSLMTQEEGEVVGAADSDSRERRLLVPVLDLINHSAEPERVCTACRVVGGSAAGADSEAVVQPMHEDLGAPEPPEPQPHSGSDKEAEEASSGLGLPAQEEVPTPDNLYIYVIQVPHFTPDSGSIMADLFVRSRSTIWRWSSLQHEGSHQASRCT